MASTSKTSTIFVGSSFDLDVLSSTALSSPLLADGDVSFYGHLSGLITAYLNGTEKQVVSTWAGTGAGVTELNEDPTNAVMRLTIANSGTGSIVIPVGTIVSSASGVRFQIELQPDIAQYWSQGTGGLGIFTIPAGASISVLAQALAVGPSGNLAANQVTQIGIAGASITGSTLDTAADQWASGTMTLRNTGTSSTIIYTTMVVTGANGKTYHIAVDPTVGGFVATDADSSSGYYVLAAGATVTIPIASLAPTDAATASDYLTEALSYNAAANSITGAGTLPSGVSIVSSSALTTTGLTSASLSGVQAETGMTGVLTDGSNQFFTANQGYTPTQANVDTYNETIWSAQDLASWEAYVDSARAQGYLNLAPMLAEYEEGDFATAAATQYIRAAALYSGGIAFDLPPWFFLARETAFQKSTEAEIKWATANGLRSSITLSPQYGGDPNLLADTKQLISMLQAAGAMPTQIVVKDGGVTTQHVLYSSTDPNALNNVANWLSSLTLTPSNSESGQEVRGTAARPDELMTGVAPSATLLGAARQLPFSIAQLFAETKTNTGTLTVTLSSASLGALVAGSGLGAVSQNGTVFTFSGTMAQMTAALQAMGFVAATGVVATGSLTVSVADAAGTITGQTAITVDNLMSLSGLATTASVSGTTLVEQSAVLTSGNAATQLTATVTLSNPSLASFWNIAGGTVSADGATLTLVGNAATVQSALRQLETVMQVGASGTEVESVSITDGTQTVSAATTLSIAAATQITAGGIPSAMVVGSAGRNLPFADIQLSDTASPTAQFSVSATLPSGAARLVAGAGGTVSADGFSFSFTGTAAQIQVALRSLAVTVSPGSAAGVEALTLSVSGLGSHVTALTVGSTDTVFVGAPDGTEDGYASSAVASPLVSSGVIGLVDDYNGIVSSVVDGTGPSLAGTWSGTGAGVFTFTPTSLIAQQTVTIRNGTGAAITVPVGTIATTASGVQFQVVQNGTANANWVAGSTGDGSLGSFVVAAGATTTLTVEAVQAGIAGNVGSNAITGLTGISGATVVSSAASMLATEVASGTVTLTNTGTSTVNVFEGTVLTNSSGSYQIGNTPTASGYTPFLSDNSNGFYVLAPGQSTTVAVYGSNAQSGTAATALQQILAQTTTATNTLSSTALPNGVVVSGSSAITATGPGTAAAGTTWGGAGAGTGVLTQNGYGRLLAGSGFGASEGSLFLPLSTNVTAADLGEMDAYVDTLRGLGMLNVSIAVSGIQDFSASAATANIRAAALYGGGIDLDYTPASILAGGSAALLAVENDIRWATQNGLRSTMTLRAYGDTSFGDETRTVMTALASAGALPSQVLVLGSPTSSTIGASELAPAVASYVATLGLTPSASESGLQTVGSTVDAVMTGVQASETVTGSTAIAPYAVAQVYAENAGTVLTATAALASTLLGTLSVSGAVSAASTVSGDGSTVTLVGTQAQIDASLAAIRYTPATGANGTTTLNLSITDSAGTITGQTRLTLGTPLVVSGLSSQSVNGWLILNPGVTVTAAKTVTVTASVKLSNASLGSYWNVNASGVTVSADGGTVTMSGTAASVQSFLDNLVFMPTRTASGTETETITVTDGFTTTSLSSTLSIAVATNFVVSGLTSSLAVSPSASNTPYQNIAITKSTSPNQDIFLWVTLPTGAAKLVSPGVGTVSADGLTYSYDGTPAQLQAALRALAVSVPTGTAAGTETLTLNINGRSTTETLNIAATSSVNLSTAALAPGGANAAPTASAATGSGTGSGTTGTSTVAVTTGSSADVLSATAGGTASGNSFTVTGTAGADNTALAGLVLTPASSTGTTSLHVALSGRGMVFTDTNPGNDLISSGGGNAINLSGGRDTVSAGLGDTISAGSGSVFASGSQRFSFLGRSSAADTVNGGAGGGVFTAGTGGASRLAAGSGATILNAAGANDTLVGGGATVLNGAANLSTNIFAAGGDTVNGAVGSIIHGPHGGTAPATINLGAGGETIIGDTGSMSVSGGSGTAHVQLGSGAATVTGGSGAETVVVAGASHATLVAGTGAEMLSMTKGLSTGAVLSLSGFGAASNDQLVLNGYGTATSGPAAAYTQSAVQGGTMLTLSDGATITLLGLSHVDASAVVLH